VAAEGAQIGRWFAGVGHGVHPRRGEGARAGEVEMGRGSGMGFFLSVICGGSIFRAMDFGFSLGRSRSTGWTKAT
jgi:hypothetical protein